MKSTNIRGIILRSTYPYITYLCSKYKQFPQCLFPGNFHSCKSTKHLSNFGSPYISLVCSVEHPINGTVKNVLLCTFYVRLISLNKAPVNCTCPVVSSLMFLSGDELEVLLGSFRFHFLPLHLGSLKSPKASDA